MSAYIVDKAHVDALVRAGVDHRSQYFVDGEPARWVSVTREERDRIGQMLTDANVASVSYRYPDDSLTDLPGPLSAWWIVPYRYSPRGPILSPVQGLKAIDGFDYQACETPDWRSSEAYAFLQGLRDTLIRSTTSRRLRRWSDDWRNA